jgi:hypothetical protein
MYNFLCLYSVIYCVFLFNMIQTQIKEAEERLDPTPTPAPAALQEVLGRRSGHRRGLGRNVWGLGTQGYHGPMPPFGGDSPELDLNSPPADFDFSQYLNFDDGGPSSVQLGDDDDDDDDDDSGSGANY